MPEICWFFIPGLALSPASKVIVIKVNQYIYLEYLLLSNELSMVIDLITPNTIFAHFLCRIYVSFVTFLCI